jgi:hypothetical protein
MKKTASVLVVFCILNASFVSCRTHKMLSVNEASEIKNAKNSLLLHTPSETFKLYNYKFSDTMLVGDLMEKTKIKGYVIHVHTKQNFHLEFDGNTVHYCELSISNIEKITYSRVSTGKTILFVGGIWLVTAVIIGLTGDIGPTISGGI